MTTRNDYEERGRERKTERLALALDEAETLGDMVLTGDEIRNLHGMVWALVAKHAGVPFCRKEKPICRKCIEVVADMFDRRLGLHAPDPATDPFKPFAKDTLENMTHPDERAAVQEMLS